jgi:DNA polymerase-3 subunit gamma/tau
MDNFVVSARKYRPQNFSTVVGQEHITTTLKNAIRHQQLAHAFLFCGPRGVGKTTCARILAKTINCENIGEDGEACNACTSCVSFNNGSSFNIHELDAASNNSVDDIRALTEQVRFAPQAGKYKVYIIDEVHMLSASAFNAFLKTLEEPPPYAIFILATTEKHKILPTILSRCQIFDFKRITTRDTVHHLEDIIKKEGIKADKASLHLIAQKSEGCMRDALSILDKIVSFTDGKLTYANTLEHLNILDEDYFFRLLEFLQKQDLAGAMLLFDEINRKGFEGETLLNGLSEFFRNLMVCQDERTLGLLETVEGFREKYAKAAKEVSLAWLISAIQILNEAEINFKQARNKKLHLELTLIRLAYMQQALEWSGGEGEAVKKKRLDSVKPVSFRQIPPLRVKSAEAKLVIEEKSDLRSEKVEVEKKPAIAGEEATLPARQLPSAQGLGAANGSLPTSQISHPTSQAPLPTSQIPDPTSPTPKPTLGALQKIRKEIGKKSRAGTEESVPLTDENLRQAWEEYIQKLTEAKNHTTATNLKLAELVITGDLNFDIYTATNIQLRFIEQERGGLIDHLHQFFRNRMITYQVLLKATEGPVEPQEKPLNKREQFQLMVEQYPLIKELKDKLNLSLD